MFNLIPKCILSPYRTSYIYRFTMHSYTTNKISTSHHSFPCSPILWKKSRSNQGSTSVPVHSWSIIGQISRTVPAYIQTMQTIIKQISCQDYLLGNLIEFNFFKWTIYRCPGVKVKVKVMKDLHANIYFITSNGWRVFTGK